MLPAGLRDTINVAANRNAISEYTEMCLSLNGAIMEHLKWLIPMLSVVLSSACSSVHLVDLKPDIPTIQIAKKYPLKAAILVQPSSMNINSIVEDQNTCPVSITFSPYPFGQY